MKAQAIASFIILLDFTLGLYSQVGQLAHPQVKVPLLPCEHYYLHTKAIEGLDPMTPGNLDLNTYLLLVAKNQ